jgi:hypothetical protein
METIEIRVYTVDAHEWISENPVNIEFQGELLLTHHGRRGEAFVYRTKKGQLAIVHNHEGASGKVLKVHPDLADVARYAEGYTRVKTPWYDEELVEAVANALGEGLPTEKLDI